MSNFAKKQAEAKAERDQLVSQLHLLADKFDFKKQSKIKAEQFKETAENIKAQAKENPAPWAIGVAVGVLAVGGLFWLLTRKK